MIPQNIALIAEYNTIILFKEVESISHQSESVDDEQKTVDALKGNMFLYCRTKSGANHRINVASMRRILESQEGKSLNDDELTEKIIHEWLAFHRQQ